MRLFGIRVGLTSDIAIPLATEPIIRPGRDSMLDQRSSWWLTLIGRLAPGATAAQAQAALRALQPALREATMPQDWTANDRANYMKEFHGYITRVYTALPRTAGAAR